MSDEPVWSGRIEVRCRDPAHALRLYRVLRPEAEREVPRARAELMEPRGETLVLSLTARDTGAMRAAIQTFLGWVQLSESAAGHSEGPALGSARRSA